MCTQEMDPDDEFGITPHPRHKRTHARTHARMRARARTLRQASEECRQPWLCDRRGMHARTHERTHACTRAHVHRLGFVMAEACAHARTHARMSASTHARTSASTNARRHARKHTRPPARKHPPTHTRMHSCVRAHRARHFQPSHGTLCRQRCAHMCCARACVRAPTCARFHALVVRAETRSYASGRLALMCLAYTDPVPAPCLLL